MTEAMPFLQKTILLSYDPRPFPAKPFFLRAHGLKNAIRARFLLSGRRKCSRSAEIVQVLRNPLSTRSYFCPDCTLHSQLVGV